jgi:Protein of unknown function, DUF547
MTRQAFGKHQTQRNPLELGMKWIQTLSMTLACAVVMAAEPDYGAWTQILKTHYNPTHGMDYEGLAKKDWNTLKGLMQSMAQVDANALNAKEQLAYYMNVYNITVVNLMMENRQVKSIRELSTDPITRINIFKKDLVTLKSGATSLKKLEDDIIRGRFKDPRIHFAINCAAKSCPPLRQEAFTGTNLDAQLDDQARAFFANPLLGARFEVKGETLRIQLTKIMDGGFWFGKDFEQWGGGKLPFLRRFLSEDKQKIMDQYSGHTDLQFDSYDWSINRWNR